MSLSHTERKRLAELRREVAEIMDPHNEEAKARRREQRKAMLKRVGKRSEGQRQPRELDNGYLAFLRRQPCAVRHLGGCEGPIQAAHIRYSDSRRGSRNPGLGTKNHDRFATPLCEAHHLRDQHAGAERAFWERAGLDAYEVAERLYAEFNSVKARKART